MFCSPWDCRWNGPVPPFAFHLAGGQLGKKLQMPAKYLSESQSEPKTRANMPLLRQLEFAFQATDPLTSILSLKERRTTNSRGEGHVILSTRDGDLEAKVRELLRSLGAGRIAAELRVEWNRRLKTAAGRAY